MTIRESLQEELKKVNEQLEIVDRQIQNSDYNIAGLIAQKTRHMDKEDALKTKKADIETQLAELPEEAAGV